MDHVSCFEFPFQLAGRRVQGIEITVAAAEVDRALRYDGTGEKNVELIGHGLVLRGQAVYSLRFKAALAFRREFPPHAARLRVERVKLSVIADDIDGPVCHRGSGRHRAAGWTFPNLTTRFRIDGVDVSVVSAEIKNLVLADRRRNDAIAGRKFPFYMMKLARRLT
jgi:hypothetical protein